MVLHKIVLASVNEGKLTNFRSEYVLMDADDKHDEDWVKAVAVPPEKQITVTPDWLGNFEPIVDAPTAQVIRARRAGIIPGAGQHTGVYAGRTLLAGRVACAHCGGALRTRSYVRRGKVYLYYICNTHDMTPTACSALSLPAWKLDIEAWDTVLAVLGKEEYTPGGHLQVLAERQAERDAAEAEASSLADLQAARDAMLDEVETLAAELGRTKSATARDAIQRRIDRLEPDIAEADRRIANTTRREQHRVAWRTLLSDTLVQWRRYASFVFGLSPYHYPENDALSGLFSCQRGAGCYAPDDRRTPYPCTVDLALTARVLNLLGAKFSVRKNADGEPDVAVELTITAAASRPWFDAEELHVLDSSQAPQPDWEHPSFASREPSLP